MPLLNKEPFNKEPIPSGLKTSDEVFHCKLTNELFTDYEKFFSRVILCNSMIWSCDLSGRSGLTYEDALSSELKMIQEIKSIPPYLLKPILYIASLIQRQKILDLIEDVYNFVKDRYFVGEQVEVFVGELMSKKVCEVLKVLKLNEAVKKSTNNLEDSDGSDVICLDDPPPPSSSNKTNDSSLKTNEYSEARFYEYIIQDIKNSSSISTVPVEKIIRRKFLLGRQKCKIILKYYCCLNKDGVWIINSKKLKNIKIESLSFESMFVGPDPKFLKSDVKRKPSLSTSLNGSSSKVKSNNQNINKFKNKKKIENHDSKQTSIKQHMHLSEKKSTNSKKEKLNNEAEMVKAFEEAKQRAIERDKKKLSAQELKKLKIQEENRKRKEAMAKERERNLPRDDLLCDNLKDLPKATKLDCLLPTRIFSNTVAIIEFINEFKSLLDLSLPKYFTIETFSKGLIASEVNGVFSKVLLELLSALMRVQDEELAAETGDDSDKKIETFLENKLEKEKVNILTQTASSMYFTPLRKLSFDVLTMTEILRLHLIGSIGESSNSKHDYQQRGGYTASDDPCAIFVEKHQDIIQKLSTISVFECSEEEKVEILNLLISQLMTYAVCRDYIEEKLEKLKVTKKNLRLHQIAVGKRKKDEALYWQKKKQEDKAKINEEPSKLPERRSKHLSDKDFENLPSENLDWEKITEDEKNQMCEWEKRKEQALLSEALSIQPSIFSLGMDRTFRRYWFFKSVPGLFVEDGDEDLPGGAIINSIPQHSPKKTPSKINLAATTGIAKNTGDSVEKNTNLIKLISEREQIANGEKFAWSFYYSIEQLASLIEGFNNRGVREINLKKNIIENEAFIVESMINSDFTFFNQNEALPTGTAKSRTSKMKSSTSESVLKYTSASEEMEAIVKDTLLDIEERIYDGTLGSMKDIDRFVWREELSNGDYKKIISYVLDMEDFCNSTISLPILGFKAALIQISKMVETRYLSPPLVFDKNKKTKNKDKKKKKEKSTDCDSALLPLLCVHG